LLGVGVGLAVAALLLVDPGHPGWDAAQGIRDLTSLLILGGAGGNGGASDEEESGEEHACERMGEGWLETDYHTEIHVDGLLKNEVDGETPATTTTTTTSMGRKVVTAAAATAALSLMIIVSMSRRATARGGGPSWSSWWSRAAWRRRWRSLLIGAEYAYLHYLYRPLVFGPRVRRIREYVDQVWCWNLELHTTDGWKESCSKKEKDAIPFTTL
jgi:hypothetical protein